MLGRALTVIETGNQRRVAHDGVFRHHLLLQLGREELGRRVEVGFLVRIFGIYVLLRGDNPDDLDNRADQHEGHRGQEDDGEPALDEGVAHNRGLDTDGLGIAGGLRLRERCLSVGVLGEVPDGGVGGENLLPGRREGDHQVEGRGNARDPGPLRPALIDHYHGAQNKRHRGNELVSHPEERVEGLDTAARVGHAHEQQRAPGRHHDGRGNPRAHPPGGILELGQHIAQRVAQLEAGHAGHGVHGGEDEERLEHNREVVPEAHHGLAATHLVQNMRDGHREGGRTTGTRGDGGFPNVFGDLIEGLRSHVGFLVAVLIPRFPPGFHRIAVRIGDREVLHRGGRKLGAVIGHLHDGRARQLIGGVLGGIHTEVDTHVEGRRRSQRHNCHEGFHEHPAVADHANLGFLLDHLRGGTGGYRCVHPGQCPAGDGNKEEGEEFPGENRSVCI